MMLEQIAGTDGGRRHLERAYQEAIREEYLWHEFGDSHLILGSGRRAQGSGLRA